MERAGFSHHQESFSGIHIEATYIQKLYKHAYSIKAYGFGVFGQNELENFDMERACFSHHQEELCV